MREEGRRIKKAQLDRQRPGKSGARGRPPRERQSGNEKKKNQKKKQKREREGTRSAGSSYSCDVTKISGVRFAIGLPAFVGFNIERSHALSRKHHASVAKRAPLSRPSCYIHRKSRSARTRSAESHAARTSEHGPRVISPRSRRRLGTRHGSSVGCDPSVSSGVSALTLRCLQRSTRVESTLA